MAVRFPSDGWITELVCQLNASEAYERSAKDWEGDFLFVVEPDADHAGAALIYLSLLHGKSLGGALVGSEDERKVEFTIRAPFGTWRQVIEGKVDPIQGMMMRKLRLEGNMMKIMRYPKAAKEIITCCARVPTDFG